jgi:hypothetical protein
MTDSPKSQGYAIHDERNARREARVKDASTPMGYANVDNSRAINSSASYPNHIISLASEGDTSDENDHQDCQNPSGIKVKFKEESKSMQLPIMQASTLQVLSIERNGDLSNSIGKSTPSSAISSIQPCNFSSTEHSVTRLRGRVLVSSTKDQCRDFILTFRSTRDNARDFMSMAKCQNCKAQDCMPERLWYKGIKGKACCQKLFYWLVLPSSEQKNGTITIQIYNSTTHWRSVRRKKTPRKSTGKTDYANFATLDHSLHQCRISMLNIKGKLMFQRFQNGCSFGNFITVPDLGLVRQLNLNLQIVHRTIVAQHSAHSKLICKSCATNIESAANLSHQCCIFYSKEKYFATKSTANAHLIRAHHRFAIDSNYATINERLSCYDKCICAGLRYKMQDQPNAIEDSQFVTIQWAWLVLLYLWYNTSSHNHAHDQSISSRLLRLVHAPIEASVFSNGSRVLSRERSVTTIDTKDTVRDISNLKYNWVSATLLLVCERVHDELRSMAPTYLSKIHITS